MNIIERAFQLAPSCSSSTELRKALQKEGFDCIDLHLRRLGIKRELRKLYKMEKTHQIREGAPQS